jgi:CxxC-x17-CxxC domain-containing protein
MGRSNNRHESKGSRQQPRGDFKKDFVSSFSRPFNSSFSEGPRPSHDAVCSDCGQACTVPFKPVEGKPVYCRQCYAKHRPKF